MRVADRTVKDGFGELFGARRGVPGACREPLWTPAGAPVCARLIGMLSHDGRPAPGLVLLIGEPGAGKSTTAVFIACELARTDASLLVDYLDCDDADAAVLIGAQQPGGWPAPRVHRPAAGRGVRIAEQLSFGACGRLVVLDSLERALEDGQSVRDAGAVLVASAQRAGATVLATCTPQSVASWRSATLMDGPHTLLSVSKVPSRVGYSEFHCQVAGGQGRRRRGAVKLRLHADGALITALS